MKTLDLRNLVYLYLLQGGGAAVRIKNRSMPRWVVGSGAAKMPATCPEKRGRADNVNRSNTRNMWGISFEHDSEHSHREGKHSQSNNLLGIAAIASTENSSVPPTSASFLPSDDIPARRFTLELNTLHHILQIPSR